MKAILSILLFVIILNYSYSEESKRVEISKIIKNFDQFKGKELEAIWRLKKVDYIFEKIVFYDKNNHDIIFDFSDKAIRKKLSKYFRNIHKGAEFYVRCSVESIDSESYISAVLLEFTPLSLDKLVK